MSYHILSIDTPTCTLTSSRGQLICVNAQGEERKLPMEDIASIVISSFNATMTSSFLIEAARCRIGLILCESHKPLSVLLPVDRATDTDLLRKISSLSSQFKQRLWKKTLQAKCLNQWALAKQWLPDHESLPLFKKMAEGDSFSKEADCAKLFWKIFAQSHVEDDSFRRGRYEGGVNKFLNYAYAVLLSSILQKLLALGIDPTFGIFHREREHSTPLAYDLMEPFRPIFDANVSRWLKENPDKAYEDDLSPDFRRHIVATLKASVLYDDQSRELSSVIESVCRSFRKAVTMTELKHYQPWKTSTIKWAGL